MFLLIWLVSELIPILSRLNEVFIRNMALKVGYGTNPFLMGSSLFILLSLDDLWFFDARNVIGQVPIVHHITSPVALGGIVRVERPIGWKLGEVDAQTVPLGVAVGE